VTAIINVVLPVFAIMLAGYLSGRFRLLGDASSEALNRFVHCGDLVHVLAQQYDTYLQRSTAAIVISTVVSVSPLRRCWWRWASADRAGQGPARRSRGHSTGAGSISAPSRRSSSANTSSSVAPSGSARAARRAAAIAGPVPRPANKASAIRR